MIYSIEKAFNKQHDRYMTLLEAYYPAHNETGFTERNLSHNFVAALESVLGDECISWFEAPINLKKKQHIDAVVFDPVSKASFMIESKRINGNSKIISIKNDIKRLRLEENIYLLEDGLYDVSIEKRYAIVLADLWTENEKREDLLATWPRFIYDNDFVFAATKDFNELSHREKWKESYNIMISVQEIKI